MRRMIASPAAIITQNADGQALNWVLTESAWLTDEADAPLSVEHSDGYSVLFIDIRDVAIDVPGRFEGTTAPSGYGITARAVRDDDCLDALNLPNFPTPVPVIHAMLTGGNHDCHLEAVLDSNKNVITLLLVTDIGFWTRRGSTWLPLPDIDPIAGMQTVIVDDSAIDIFDPIESAGRALHIAALPALERWV